MRVGANGAVALVEASWLTARSYRVGLIVSLAWLVASVIPIYFIANALQPVMAIAIAREGTQYFGFVLLGTIALSFVVTALTALPNAIGSGIASGTLEALLATPTPVPAIVAGLTGYGFLWTLLRGALLLAAGAVLGARIDWGHALPAMLILGMIILSYFPFGLIAGALVLAFRTTGPLAQGVIVASSLLGGVYYPTSVIPSWLRQLADLMPLTYGLRALRHVLLDGASLIAVRQDLMMVLLFMVTLGALGVGAFAAALSYARRTGSLAQY